jgi:hypothetical protein
MKTGPRYLLVAVILLCAFSFFTAQPVFANEVTITGEVNDEYQVVAGGQIYEIENTPEGNDLVLNYVGQVVKLTGTERVVEEVKIITVKTFTVVTE